MQEVITSVERYDVWRTGNSICQKNKSDAPSATFQPADFCNQNTAKRSVLDWFSPCSSLFVCRNYAKFKFNGKCSTEHLYISRFFCFDIRSVMTGMNSCELVSAELQTKT